MRAIVIDDYGTAPTIADIEPPTAGPGQIRVKVKASSLNGFDLTMARGYGSLLADGGRYATLLSTVPSGDRPITAFPVYATPDTATLDRLASLAVAGDLRMPVQRTYSLDAVPKAFDDFAAGTLGKLAVAVDGSLPSDV